MPATPDAVARLLDPQVLEAVEVMADRLKVSREAALAYFATRGLEATLQDLEAAAGLGHYREDSRVGQINRLPR